MSSPNATSLQLEAGRLSYIGMIFIQCYCYVVIPFGLVGHLMSIYVFTRPALRTTPCTRYFLAATIVGLLNTCYTLPMRMVQSGFDDTDPGAHSTLFCKITWLIQYTLRVLPSWLVVLACADRYFCSCTSMSKRAWSSLDVANRLIAFTVLFNVIAHIHVPILFTIDIIPATQKPICYPPGPPGTYRIVLSFFDLIYFGLSPSFCMLLFGILTIQNIVRSKRTVAGSSTNVESTANQNTRRINRQMLRMLFTQVLVFCVTSLAYSISAITTSINSSQPKNVVQVAQDSLNTAVVGMLSNTGPCLSFYLFTLSSHLFRRELVKLFCRLDRIGGNQIQLPNIVHFRTNINH